MYKKCGKLRIVPFINSDVVDKLIETPVMESNISINVENDYSFNPGCRSYKIASTNLSNHVILVPVSAAKLIRGEMHLPVETDKGLDLHWIDRNNPTYTNPMDHPAFDKASNIGLSVYVVLAWEDFSIIADYDSLVDIYKGGYTGDSEPGISITSRSVDIQRVIKMEEGQSTAHYSATCEMSYEYTSDWEKPECNRMYTEDMRVLHDYEDNDIAEHLFIGRNFSINETIARLFKAKIHPVFIQFTGPITEDPDEKTMGDLLDQEFSVIPQESADIIIVTATYVEPDPEDSYTDLAKFTVNCVTRAFNNRFYECKKKPIILVDIICPDWYSDETLP